jgi:DNA polymerase-3 subunit delta'
LLSIDKQYDSLPWLTAHRQHLAELVRTDRCPHALLIQGRAGSGRRQLALWLTQELLGSDPTRVVDNGAGSAGEVGHPDFRTLEILPDKKSVGVDQVRELIQFLSLTSHGSGARVAVVYPADSLTRNAANSLLKTLEEPPGHTVIVLISESLGKLPATVISRCQQIRIAPAADEATVDWLRDQSDGADLSRLLDFAGGAPLAALGLHERDFAALATSFAADLQGLERRQLSPIVVARRWKAEPELALQWLYWQLARRARALLDGSAGTDGGSEALNQAALQSGFRQMGQIRDLRRLINGGINAELSLAELLMDWYGGLGHQ